MPHFEVAGMIPQVPGWIFPYLAFDMFVKLHPHRP
jgi:hypothetical protein